MEKKNDDFRRFFHSKINKWDTCKDLLVVEKLLQKLENTKRTPRKYVKKSEAFWCNGGKQAVARSVKRKAVEDLPPPPLPSPPTAGETELLNYETMMAMTVTTLAKKLSELQGKKIGKRSKAQLIQQILKEQERRTRQQ